MKANGYSKADMARALGRPRCTITREMKRNSFDGSGKYWADRADSMAMARRRSSRRNSQYSQQEWAEVEALLHQQWSPKQIVGTALMEGRGTMSYESISASQGQQESRRAAVEAHEAHGQGRAQAQGQPRHEGQAGGQAAH